MLCPTADSPSASSPASHPRDRTQHQREPAHALGDVNDVLCHFAAQPNVPRDFLAILASHEIDGPACLELTDADLREFFKISDAEYRARVMAVVDALRRESDEWLIREERGSPFGDGGDAPPPPAPWDTILRGIAERDAAVLAIAAGQPDDAPAGVADDGAAMGGSTEVPTTGATSAATAPTAASYADVTPAEVEKYEGVATPRMEDFGGIERLLSGHGHAAEEARYERDLAAKREVDRRLRMVPTYAPRPITGRTLLENNPYV
jgi:hypothetical protein